MNLDFRSKIAMTVVISYILLLGNLHHHYFPVVVFLSALPYLLLLLERKYVEALKGLVLLGIAILMQLFLLHRLSSSVLEAIFLFMSILPNLSLPRPKHIVTGSW